VGRYWVFEEGRRVRKRTERDFRVSVGDQKACRAVNQGS
jgi:hypothetical protein